MLPLKISFIGTSSHNACDGVYVKPYRRCYQSSVHHENADNPKPDGVEVKATIITGKITGNSEHHHRHGIEKTTQDEVDCKRRLTVPYTAKPRVRLSIIEAWCRNCGKGKEITEKACTCHKKHNHACNPGCLIRGIPQIVSKSELSLQEGNDKKGNSTQSRLLQWD